MARTTLRINLLTKIADSVNQKYKTFFSDSKSYKENYRNKRGIFNGIGTNWKLITGNLDSSDGEDFNDCIDKITRKEHEIDALLKKKFLLQHPE